MVVEAQNSTLCVNMTSNTDIEVDRYLTALSVYPVHTNFSSDDGDFFVVTSNPGMGLICHF